jgi:hypothetical protein
MYERIGIDYTTFNWTGGERWGRHAQIAIPVVLCIEVLSTNSTLHYLALVWPNAFL